MASPAPVPESSPRSIRASLLPEDVGTFDSEYRHAMAEATETLDLNPVLDLLERWRRVAWSSADPVAHRRMLSSAGRLEAGEDLRTEPWVETRARLGVERQA